jgi:hypothetical protein
MLTAISAVAKRSLNRPLVAFYSQMSQAQIGVSKSLQRDTDHQPVTIPFSSRLIEGRALTQDVWSIFRYISILISSNTF